MILFRLFPIRIRFPVIIAAAVYSASFAFAGTRTQDLFSHLYVCREGGVRAGAGARGYVNFSVKIHFVIMDFPCRIHRCHRRRLCHDTTTSATSHFPDATFSPHTTATITSIRSPEPRVLMFLGHDRWQVSVGVACKFFFFWVLERAPDMF